MKGVLEAARFAIGSLWALSSFEGSRSTTHKPSFKQKLGFQCLGLTVSTAASFEVICDEWHGRLEGCSRLSFSSQQRLCRLDAKKA